MAERTESQDLLTGKDELKEDLISLSMADLIYCTYQQCGICLLLTLQKKGNTSDNVVLLLLSFNTLSFLKYYLYLLCEVKSNISCFCFEQWQMDEGKFSFCLLILLFFFYCVVK